MNRKIVAFVRCKKCSAEPKHDKRMNKFDLRFQVGEFEDVNLLIAILINLIINKLFFINLYQY